MPPFQNEGIERPQKVPRHVAPAEKHTEGRSLENTPGINPMRFSSANP